VVNNTVCLVHVARCGLEYRSGTPKYYECEMDAVHEMMSDANPPTLRKRQLEVDGATRGRAADEVDIVSCATIAYSSENPAHPVEHLLDGRSGPGATRWISARSDVTEQIVVEFDQPQTISRLVYEVEEAVRERIQEVRVEVSEDGGRTYRQILVQEYTFSPRGATYQCEEQRLNLHQVSHLRLTIVPNKSGSGAATLTALRLFA
jgi:F5/8 type C domain